MIETPGFGKRSEPIRSAKAACRQRPLLADCGYVVEEERSAGIYSASPVGAYDTTTRARRFVLGNFPAALTLDVFSSQADPVVFGEAGLIRAFVTTLAPSVGFELFLFKSDTHGLTQVTP